MRSKIICLSKNDEFKEILKGRKNSNKYFTIFFKKLTNKNNKKLNISFIAKKKLGNAVKRNKIKRKLIKIVDVLGRTTTNTQTNTPLFYIYDDGSVERKIILN